VFLRVLGTLVVETGPAGTAANPLRIPGAKERALLGRLLVVPGRAVPVDALVDDLWDGEPPPTARKSLQAHVVRLRTALEPERSKGSPGRYVVRRGDGYLVAVDATEVDASVVGTQAAAGRAAHAAGDATEARMHFATALDLWRGEPFADWRDASWTATERRRLAALHAGLVEGRVDADLALGRHRELVPELETLTTTDPLNEAWWARLMVALYRSDRQGDALATARRARTMLIEELGVEPGPLLRALEQDVLDQSDTLLAPGGVVTAVPRPRAGEPEACPYRGLIAYDVGDAALLHGRGATIRALVAKVRVNRLVVVSGPSGAGKSSLVRAGLLPRLAAGAMPGSETWRQVVVTPGRRPVDRLAPLLAEPGPAPVVLVVDQFEEVWTSGIEAGEREAFLAALLGLLEDDVAARVVLVARGDHLGRLAESPDLAEAATPGLMLVPPMTEAEVREAIETPAAVAGLEVEPDLTEAVLREVSGQAGILPLLSSALVGTWERRRGRTLTLAGYLESGGVTGALAGIAEAAMGELNEAERELARRLLVRLATSGEGGTVVRRRVALAELGLDDAARRQVLEVFVSARLLTVDADHVEVTHEAVFTAWPRLVAWLAEDAANRAVRAHLAPAAATWAADGRPDDQLYRGARLDAAQEWIGREDSDPTPEEAAFVAASTARSRAELEEARSRAEQERAGRRRVRRLAVVLAATAAVALAAGTLALGRQREASESAVRADAERLAAASTSVALLDVRMLLAAQAYRLRPTDQTQDALFSAALEGNAVLGIHRHAGVRKLGVGADAPDTVFEQDTRDVLAWRVGADAPRTLAGLGSQTGLPAGLDGSPAPSGPAAGLLAVVGSASVRELPTVRLVDDTGAVRWSLGERLLGGWPVSARFTAAGTEVVVEVLADRLAEKPEQRAFAVDVATGRIRRLPVAERFSGTLIAVGDWGVGTAPGGRVMINAGADRRAVFDLQSGKITVLDTDLADIGGEGDWMLAKGAFETSHSGAMAWYPLGSSTPTQRFVSHLGDLTALGSDLRSTVAVTGGSDRRIVVTGLVGTDQGPEWRQRQAFAGHDGQVRDIVVTADGARAYSAGSDDRIMAWDLTGRHSFAEAMGLIRAPGALATGSLSLGDPVRAGTAWVVPSLAHVPLDPEGSITISVLFVDAASRKLVQSVVVTPGPEGAFNGLSPAQAAVSPDGMLVAVGAYWTAGVVDVATHRVVARVRLPVPPERAGADPTDRVVATAWSGDGRRLFLGTGGGDERDTGHGALVAVDTASWQPDGRRLDLGAAVVKLAMRDDGRFLAAGLATGEVVVVDPARLEVVHRLRASGPVQAMAFSPDTGVLAAVGSGGALDVWNVASGTAAMPPQRMAAVGTSVQWLPGDVVAYGGADGRVILYDLRRRAPRGVAMPAFQDGASGDVHIAPVTQNRIELFAGVRAAGSPKDGSRYSLDPADWLQHVCRVVGRDLTREEWHRYLPEREYRPTCSDLNAR
jgi:DNA-binding SARP family transcriptional activator/WD40 repeat protein